MMNPRMVPILFFALLAGCSPSNQTAKSGNPENGPETSPTAKSPEATPPGTTRIPFVLTKANNISILATIDKKHSVNLMLHTGFDGVSLTKETTARFSDLKLDKSETVTSWGGKAKSRSGDNHSLQIGDLTWEGITIGESEFSGPATDGKFGLDLFSDKIIEIDFDHSRITLHSKVPEMDPGFQKLNLIHKDNLWFIEGTVEAGKALYQNPFMIHSGFGGTVLLDDEFIIKHQLAGQLKTTSETDLKDSYGNIGKTRNVLLPSIRFGNSKLEGVSVGLFDAALGRQKLSVLGGNLLKRFHIILDRKGSWIYLKPNSHFGDPLG